VCRPGAARHTARPANTPRNGGCARRRPAPGAMVAALVVRLRPRRAASSWHEYVRAARDELASGGHVGTLALFTRVFRRSVGGQLRDGGGPPDGSWGRGLRGSLRPDGLRSRLALYESALFSDGAGTALATWADHNPDPSGRH